MNVRGIKGQGPLSRKDDYIRLGELGELGGWRKVGPVRVRGALARLGFPRQGQEDSQIRIIRRFLPVLERGWSQNFV